MLWGCQTAQTQPEPPLVHVGTRFSVSNDSAGTVSVTDSSDAKPGKVRADIQQTAAFEELPDATDAKLESHVPAAANDPAFVMQLTLDQAIATSLDRNPTLATARAAEPVAEAICQVAQVYPWNPYVQVEVIPYDRELPGFQGAIKNYVLLMQTLELAHQQQHRQASAAAALNQVRWNIVQAELTNAALTERLYFTAIYQRDLRDLARRTATLNQEVLDVVEQRFQKNLGLPTDRTTAQVTARQSRKQAELAEANYQTALLALRRQINLPANQPLTLVGRLEDFAWRPVDGMEARPANESGEIRVPDEMSENLAMERPDVRAAQAGTNVAQANAALARANVVQNIQIGPYYERDDLGTLFFGLRGQMNIPVWDSGRPLARQREAEMLQQATTFDQLRSRAEVEVQTALERYERARRLAERERPESSRNVPQELQRVKEQFDAGQAEILAVFAVQNNLLQERRTYLDVLNELALAASDVTLAAGIPPARIISGQASGNPLPPAAPAVQ